MPQRVPISPQWSTNFWATGVREFGDVLVCTLISVISLYSEITKINDLLSRVFCGRACSRSLFRSSGTARRVLSDRPEGRCGAGLPFRHTCTFPGFPHQPLRHTFLWGSRLGQRTT